MDLQAVDAGLLQSRYRLTRQRSAILRALGDGSHLSAEAIHERVRAELPNVSLGTIYRTLDILRELGLVQMFSHAGHAALYEATIEKHYHLLCTRCHSLTNVNSDGVGEIVRTIALANNFRDVESSLTIIGLCAGCR
jgi:Fe2+ or Zn2+ uptake regulation protein